MMKLTIDFDKFEDLGLQAKIVMSYLVDYYNINIKDENFKYFGGYAYVFLPVKIMKDDLDLSAFQQRNILDEIEKQGYITTKLGQSRSRYFKINVTKAPSKKLQLISKIKKMSDQEVSEMFNGLIIE